MFPRPHDRWAFADEAPSDPAAAGTSAPRPTGPGAAAAATDAAAATNAAAAAAAAAAGRGAQASQLAARSASGYHQQDWVPRATQVKVYHWIADGGGCRAARMPHEWRSNEEIARDTHAYAMINSSMIPVWTAWLFGNFPSTRFLAHYVNLPMDVGAIIDLKRAMDRVPPDCSFRQRALSIATSLLRHSPLWQCSRGHIYDAYHPIDARFTIRVAGPLHRAVVMDTYAPADYGAICIKPTLAGWAAMSLNCPHGEAVECAAAEHVWAVDAYNKRVGPGGRLPVVGEIEMQPPAPAAWHRQLYNELLPREPAAAAVAATVAVTLPAPQAAAALLALQAAGPWPPAAPQAAGPAAAAPATTPVQYGLLTSGPFPSLRQLLAAQDRLAATPLLAELVAEAGGPGGRARTRLQALCLRAHRQLVEGVEETESKPQPLIAAFLKRLGTVINANFRRNENALLGFYDAAVDMLTEDGG
ncbi:MAG: hypothetical protein J3K34DRAFT_502436 [Monoraphidium minutum]|nr:MAG: hypothetical protein J3K34DRAFT_502436 [Monoraphidium minutum]